MSDRYRRLLTSYRPAAVPKVAESPLDAERERVLLEFVRRMLEDQGAGVVAEERRRSFRRPYPSVILMTPCDGPGQPRVAETVRVIGKDLTPGSIGFVHSRSPRERLVLLTLRVEAGSPLLLLTAIRRVQPVRQGLYLIGGEFVERWDTRGGNAQREVIGAAIPGSTPTVRARSLRDPMSLRRGD